MLCCNFPPIVAFIADIQFQSLIGIMLCCNRTWPDGEITVAEFQSLIGIMLCCNRPGLEALVYLVFKVQFRQSKMIVPFQPLGLSRGKNKNSQNPCIARVWEIASTSFGDIEPQTLIQQTIQAKIFTPLILHLPVDAKLTLTTTYR